jgi:hypothetical protein
MGVNIVQRMAVHICVTLGVNVIGWRDDMGLFGEGMGWSGDRIGLDGMVWDGLGMVWDGM